MNIVFCLDDNFAGLLTVAVASILKNANTDDYFHFYILHNGLSRENIKKFKKLRKIKKFKSDFIMVDEDKFLKDFYSPDLSGNKVYWYRLVAPQIIYDFSSHKIDRMLYLDADILVNKSLCNLYKTNLKEDFVAFVRSPLGEEEKEYIPNLGLNSGHKYFYSGLILLDVKKWIDNRICQKAIDVIRAHQKIFRWPDMDVLNIVFDNNNYVALHPKYSIWPGLNLASYEYKIENYLKIYENIYSIDEVKEAFYHPVIYQLAGGAKPWGCCATIELKRLFYKYAEGTAFKKVARGYLGSEKKEARKYPKWLINILYFFIPRKKSANLLCKKYIEQKGERDV